MRILRAAALVLVTGINADHRSTPPEIHRIKDKIEHDNVQSFDKPSKTTTTNPFRVECKTKDKTEQACNNLGCEWVDLNFCQFPESYRLYSQNGDSQIYDKTEGAEFFSRSIQQYKITTENQGKYRLRVKITDTSGARYEVPVPVYETSDKTDPVYNYNFDNAGGFSVNRKNGDSIFDTTIAPIIFEDQFLQISSKINRDDTMYGFGEKFRDSTMLVDKQSTLAFFARDQPVEPGLNEYGTHPFFEVIETDGKAFGVLLMNSNAMEVDFQGDTMTYRTIGGVLDFYFFFGENPEHLIQLYTEAIGRPQLPPYWALGFQICRYGYTSIEDVKNQVEENINANVPFDIQYVDIDYMERQMDFTIAESFKGLGDFVKNELKRIHKKEMIIILDPAIAANETAGTYPTYTRGVEKNVFLSGFGKVWPYLPNWENLIPENCGWNCMVENAASWVQFPDFFNENAKDWWKQEILEFYEKVEFGGIWIDMNEPASFVNGNPDGKCPENSLNHPPYLPPLWNPDLIFEKTTCMDVEGVHGKQYDLHNLYGYSETEPTMAACEAATGKRCPVISRSTFPGSAARGAGHWLGDNKSRWNHLRQAVIGAQEFSLYGFSYIGSDICGFGEETTRELCIRWTQVGAFHTFSRNHNGIGEKRQDPGSSELWSLSDTIDYFNEPLRTRYRLLPFLYTLMYAASKTGSTVVRPVSHIAPTDRNTHDLPFQFFWGDSLHFAPAVYQNQDKVDVYLPVSDKFYDWFSGDLINSGFTSFNSPLETYNIHLRGGFGVFTQDIGNAEYESISTKNIRNNNFELHLALDAAEASKAELFWDDGDSLEGSLEGNFWKVNVQMKNRHRIIGKVESFGGKVSLPKLEKLRILGVRSKITSLSVDGQKRTLFTNNNGVLEVFGLNIDIRSDFEIFIDYDHETDRVDCITYYGGNDYEGECLKRGCMWKAPIHGKSEDNDIPWCFYNHASYEVASSNNHTLENGVMQEVITLFLTESKVAPYGEQWPRAQLLIDYLPTGPRLKFINPFDLTRYQVPSEALSFDHLYEPGSLGYTVFVSRNPGDIFTLKISRNGETYPLLEMNELSLVLSNNFLQISNQANSEFLYGFGEHGKQKFKREFDWTIWPIWARDWQTRPEEDGKKASFYGHQTMYINVEQNGKSPGQTHGVYFHNSNAQEVQLSPGSKITYRTTGGVLDFFMFIEQTPEKVVSSYTHAVGKPILPPFWALGFHLCRWGYTGTAEIRSILKNMNDKQFPMDVQWFDIDYMESYIDFTINSTTWADLPEFTDDVHKMNKKVIVMMDPGIKSDLSAEQYPTHARGLEKDVYMKTPEGGNTVAYVWPGELNFPDFQKPDTQVWWADEFSRYRDEVNFDGTWIDMNEPANFNTDTGAAEVCTDEYSNPVFVPRLPRDTLWFKTVCLNNVQHWGRTFDVKELYAHSMAQATRNYWNSVNERGFILTRSNFAGTGAHAQHWLGDNFATWDQLRQSFSSSFEYGLFGFSQVGADICGFIDVPSEELCMRWQQAGAFYSFSRNHNLIGDPSQEPTAWPEESFQVMKTAMRTRYRLLLNLYTVIYETSKMDSGTVFRSLATEFAYDNNALTIDYQFMWGESLMFAPIVHEGETLVDVYFPRDTVWYQLMDEPRNYSNPIPQVKYCYGVKKFNADKKVPVFVKGGKTITVQNMKETDITTVDMQENSIKIIVALDEPAETSIGSLYIDDGVSINPDNSYVEFKTESTGTEIMPSFKFSSKTRSTGGNLREIRVSGVEFIGIKCPYLINVYFADGRSILPSVVHKFDGNCDLYVDFEDYANFDGYFEAKLGLDDIELFLGKKPDSDPMTTETTSTVDHSTSSDSSSSANVETLLKCLTISFLAIFVIFI